MIVRYPGPPCPAQVRFFERAVWRHGRSERKMFSEFTADASARTGAMRLASDDGSGLLERFWGAADIAIGVPDFDRRFVIQSDPPALARRVLDAHLRSRIERWNAIGDGAFVLSARPGQVRLCTATHVRGAQLASLAADGYEVVRRVMSAADGPARPPRRHVCGACGNAVSKADGFRCRACKAPHHAGCWRRNQGCATFACGERRLLRERRRAASAGARPDPVLRIDGPPARALVRFYHHDLPNWRIHYTEFLADVPSRRLVRVVTPNWDYGLDFRGVADVVIGVPAFDDRYVLQGDVSSLTPPVREAIARLDAMGTGPFLFERRRASLVVRVSHRLRRVTAMQEFVEACHALIPRADVMIQSVAHRADARCPVCGTPTVSRRVACRSCGTPHHAECWEYNDGCSIFACGGRVRG